MARSGGTKLGMVTLLLDVGKAYAAVVIASHLVPGVYDVQVAAAVATVMGHMFQCGWDFAEARVRPARWVSYLL